MTTISENEQKTVEWYLKAAEQGNANAQYIIGYCYQHGLGIKKDEQNKKTVEWYLKAAEQVSDRGHVLLNDFHSKVTQTNYLF